jgi:hypothetical protein
MDWSKGQGRALEMRNDLRIVWRMNERSEDLMTRGSKIYRAQLNKIVSISGDRKRFYDSDLATRSVSCD